MKLKRVKGGGKRWKKGHSCVSNPENMSHREAAKGNFFQKLTGESGLTVEALAAHTAALSVGSKLCADAEDDRSIGKTFNTFATNFSTCTIPAFEKFFRSFTVDSELQTRMLAIHAAAQEYIQDSKLPETSTSFMCALMVSLEGIKTSEEDVTATLSLLAKVIRKVSREVLKAKFGEFAKLFDEVFTHFASSNNTKLLINVIGCISLLLRAQDEVQWTYSYTMNLFQKIVSFTTNENGDIRTAAQYNASAVLKGSHFLVPEEKSRKDEDEEDMEEEGASAIKVKQINRIHPAASSTGKFVITNMKLASQSMNGKTTLHLLIFLQQIINSLPEKILEQSCACLLGVMHIGDAVVKSRSLKVLGALFCPDARGVGALSLDTTEALVNVLTIPSDAETSSRSLRLVPGMNAPDAALAWMNTVSAGIVQLGRFDEAIGMQWFTSWVRLLVSFWKSDYDSVREKVWHVIDYVFDEFIKPLKEKSASHVEALLEAFRHIEKCLSLQFEQAWPYVFSSLSLFFWVLGPHTPMDLIACLKNLSSMMDAPNLKGKRPLENAIGAAINGMGPAEVMKVVPLQITGEIRVDENFFWILPLLKTYVKNSELCFFESHFVHLASKCYILLDNLKTQGKLDTLLGKTYQLIERQIWALFPSFANGAVDLEKALAIQSFSKLICDHIKFREDTRIDIMAGLRNMVDCSEKNSRLIVYGKNYLPALFNVYLLKPRDKAPAGSHEGTVESGQRLAAFITIQKYLSILPPVKVLEFFNLILMRHEKEKSDLVQRKALLNLSRSFLPYLDNANLATIYMKVKCDVEAKRCDSQKTAYRIIEDILTGEGGVCRAFVAERIEDMLYLLFTSSASVVTNAKTPRLKCLSKVLPHLPLETPKDKVETFFRQVVLEAVQSCGRQSSVATRKAAFSLLSEVGKSVQSVFELNFEETFQCCFSFLPPITPPSDTTANTVLALMALSYQYRDAMPLPTLHTTMNDISSLLATQDRSMMESSLSFIRMAFVLYAPPVMSDHVDGVVARLIAIPDDGRKKFRIKLRDILSSLIRKFGADRIKGLIPESDLIHKMVTNLVKKDNRRKRTTKKDSEDSEEEDAEEAPTSLDEILQEIDREIERDEKSTIDKRPKLKAKAKGKRQTWIKEDQDEIVDLLDLTSGQNITSKKPKAPKQLRFKEDVPQTDEEKYGFRLHRRTNKFIITEQEFEQEGTRDADEDEEHIAFEEISGIVPQGEKSKKDLSTKRKRKLSEESDHAEQPAEKVGSAAKFATKKKFDYGSEFRSKKSGGDVARKGGVSPYAYVQFSKDTLNRRKKAKYAGQFKSLVKGASKGATKGKKMKARRK